MKIRFHEKGDYQSLAETVYYKNDMHIDFYMRWRWFFDYRAALLRVRYPRATVIYEHGGYDKQLPGNLYEAKLKNLLAAARKELTQYKCKMEYARNCNDLLFPIEDDARWNKVEDKLSYYEERVIALEQEYDTFKRGESNMDMKIVTDRIPEFHKFDENAYHLLWREAADRFRNH